MTKRKFSLLFLLLQYAAFGALLAIILNIFFPNILTQLQLTKTAENWIESTTTSQPSYADAINKAAPAVVSISSFENSVINKKSKHPYALIPQTPLGSGVIIKEDGYIVTNYHVLEHAKNILVSLPDGKQFEASVVGKDKPTDLAVLHIEAERLPVISIADSRQAQIGDAILAIGYPLGGGLTVTSGIVSAFGKEQAAFEEYIQIDAAINPGNSGGALINAYGELLGINSAFIKKENISGISFAIPNHIAFEVVEQLLANGAITRGWVGFTGVPPSIEFLKQAGIESNAGILIEFVSPNSPAAQAGIKRFDYVTHINSKLILGISDLKNAIAHSKPGSEIVLSLIRQGKHINLKLITAKRPEDV